MATLTQNQDGTLTITLTQQEQFTFSALSPGELESIITSVMDSKSKIVFQDKFATLTPDKQAQVMTIFTTP